MLVIAHFLFGKHSITTPKIKNDLPIFGQPKIDIRMTENEISKIVVHSSLTVHKALGPGLLESVYEEALSMELLKAGLQLKRQFAVPVMYNGVNMDLGYRMDILVNDKLIIEIKSVDSLASVHHKQLLTYLKLRNLKLGLLINFNVGLIKMGIHRIANGLDELDRK